MKLVLPKQHGAWAKLLIPFLLGVIKGDPTILHIPLFFGWLLLYLATFPLLMVVKNKKQSFYLKWTLYYLVPAIVLLTCTVIFQVKLLFFGASIIPFLLLNIYFAKKRDELALINDFSAIVVFGIGGLASYFCGTGRLDYTSGSIFLLTTLFFIGSTLYVKTMIREKGNLH
jgi:hypothetical protein